MSDDSDHEIYLGNSPPHLQFTLRRTKYVLSQRGTVIYGNAQHVALAYNFTTRARGNVNFLNISDSVQ